MIRHRLRTFALGVLALLLAGALALTLWLRQHPEAVIAALNARLSPGIALAELHGLRVSALGGRLGLLTLEASGARLRVEDARWFWRLAGLWPLRVEPQSLAMRALDIRLAPPTPVQEALLPRFWLAAWWPLAANLDAVAEQLRLSDSTGALLLEGRFDASDGGVSGTATLGIAGMPPLALRWQPQDATPRAWRIDWHGEGAAAPAGTLLLRGTPAGADWQFEARLPPRDAGGVALGETALSARGSSDLFEAQGALAAATLQFAGTAHTPRGTADWRCDGALTLQQSLESTLGIPGCEASLGDAHATLRGRLGATAPAREAWRATLDGDLELHKGPHALKTLDVTATFAAEAGKIRGSGAFARAKPGKLLGWDGDYTPASGRYRATLTLDSAGWDWGEGLARTLLGARQTLVPGELLAGELRATARVRGTAGHLRVAIEASARRLSGIAAGIGVAGLDCAPLALTIEDGAVAAFAATPCTVASVNAGVTLDRLRATLAHDAAGWWLRDIGGELLGGDFGATELGPLGAAPMQTRVALEGIELARVAALLEDPALTLTGTLAGTVPVRIADGAFTVQHAEVHASTPGLIRYRPAAPPADESPEIAFTRKALSNLEYDTLDAEFDYGADGTLALVTRVRGRNPDLDPVRPVHLNLTLETNLRTLLRSLTAGDRITDWLEQRTQRDPDTP